MLFSFRVVTSAAAWLPEAVLVLPRRYLAMWSKPRVCCWKRRSRLQPGHPGGSAVLDWTDGVAAAESVGPIQMSEASTQCKVMRNSCILKQ